MKRPPAVPRLKLVIFDLDGTLVDAYQAIADSLNFMLGTMGHPTQSTAQVTRAVGWGVDTLVATFVGKKRAAEGLKLFRQHHDRRLRRNVRLLPGVKTVLPYLKKRGCRLAVASNRPTKFCHILLQTLAIDQYFDHVVCGDAVRRAKPHPDMVKAILKAAAVRPAEAVFVGDMSVDVLCGQRAGVMTVAIPTGSCTRQELVDAGPDRLIGRLTQLKQLFS